jgi:ABC-2 type transport system permease protein
MSPARWYEVFRLEFVHIVKRPIFWVQLLILGFFAFALANGNAQISSGDARVGGTKAWITSEFAVTQLLILLLTSLYVFFISVVAGMSLIKDDEVKVGEMLRATRLTPAEYVWGKFAAIVAAFSVLLFVHLAMTAFFNHVLPHGANVDSIGPFALGSYLRPALLFGLPSIVLFAGVCFAMGGLTRQPVLVFAFPIAVLVLGLGFLWDWSPAWLSLGWNRALQFVDLSSYRWIKETYLKVDRGVDFYNHAHVALDGLMIAQRLVTVGVGLLAVALVAARQDARQRSPRLARPSKRSAARALAAAAAAAPPLDPAPVAALGMGSGTPGFVASTWEIARTELKLLGRHPGLYLFVPLILVQIFGGLVQVGAFDTPLLQTSGLLAMSTLNALTLLVSMVLLFYTTEALQREVGAGLAPITYSTPSSTAAYLVGKALANALLGAAILVAALIGCAIVLAIQGKAPFALTPFAIVWGLLLVPTLLVWTTFTCAVFAGTGNRFAAYSVGLAAIGFTGWLQARGKMNWVGNWDLWSATRWSDISPFELDRTPLVLNRIMVLGLAALFVVLTLRLFARRERDASRQVDRMRPAALGRATVALLPWIAVPAIAGTTLAVLVHGGWQGGAAEKKEHDYWRKNVLTYRDFPLPAIAGLELDVRLEPAQREVASHGTYTLVNRTEQSLARVPLTGNWSWRDVAWTMNGARYAPENRAGLYVFTPARPLAPGDSLRVGWTFRATEPVGISKNGNGLMEFALPSSVVLTGFDSANLAPILGYRPEVGVKDKENGTDPKEFTDDFYVGKTAPGIPMADCWYDTNIRVDAPADLMVNATGECVSDVTRGGRRLTTWKSDHPVRIWNLVAGRWKEKKGDGVVIDYDPHHPYNVDEMMKALEGARRWYGEWFAPYPWKTLRLSEFAGLAGYAQGSPGNITFSEAIGFLTRSTKDAKAAFWVAAHESAHQWWPNMALAGYGPGGDVLSEGMAHFSTILLTEQVLGEEQREVFCKDIEYRYADTRRKDSERPLVKVNGELPGDSRIIYDKGGWSLWMLFRLMGRDAGLAAQKDYMATYRDSSDHPVLQDYLAVMRRHAPDPVAFDAFVHQWFYDVVVPQYLVEDAKATLGLDGRWTVTARVKNVGTGTMPIDVAATKGERFPHDAKATPAAPAPGAVPPAAASTARAAEAKPRYEDARATLLLGAGEEKSVRIECAFKPDKFVVDPDVHVLQLERKKATVAL